MGGVVRDLLLGRLPRDLDIVTAARPGVVVGLFDRTIAAGQEFGVVAVVTAGHAYEVATFRREGPYLDGRRPSYVDYADVRADVLRRDFTVNALLYDPSSGTVLDFVDGRADLQRRIIRTVGDPIERLREDRLRMLRAVRFAVELEFAIEPTTIEAIRTHARDLSGVSAERIRDELLRLLLAPGRADGIQLLESVGMLRVVLPEVAAMAGVPQPPQFHPEGDVLTHTCLALRYLEQPTAVLAMATLLHDVGKPPTYSVTDRIRFNNHAEVGAAIAEQICRRLRVSAAATRGVAALVRDHLRIGDLPRMRPGRARQFLRRPEAGELLALHRADCLASHNDLRAYHWALGVLAEIAAAPPRRRLITGDDLIALGYTPGPRFAEMLEAVAAAQEEGDVATPEEARTWIQARFKAGSITQGTESRSTS